ncbi:MAG: Na/Pi cotransporter family protein [Firmicutes bacterium]|nr:Na/Pi cotransporter family protein [Bacillota bacterium]
MTISNVITLLSGLAFFLFGMDLLGDGLKKVAGSKLEMILEKLTSTTFKGILLGTLVTAVIQSSSATTVMVVGFVNSGIMQLGNAIGIIMGANIGTTATGWILTLAGVDGGGIFSSATIFALVAFIGIILYFFIKKPLQNNIGLIMLAFSILMTGMDVMKNAMAPLKESPAFINFISTASNPLLAIIIGIIVTAIIQSCSASIGILQALSITGVISYEVAVPMVIGMCIGACAPVLLSAIGANVNGKRAALVYLTFNLTGACVIVIPFYIVHLLVGFDFMTATSTSAGIAIVNTAYKVAATVILGPFAKVIEKISVTLIKNKVDDEDEDIDHLTLDPRLLEYPGVALEQCGIALNQMSAAAFKNLTRSIDLLRNFNQTKFAKIHSREEKVDRLEDKLGSYLVQLNSKELGKKETVSSAMYLKSLSNVERISDHAVNIAELAEELATKKITFSEQAMEELNVCIEAVSEIADITHAALEDNNLHKAALVEPLETVIDTIAEELKARHIKRVQAGNCTLELGFIYNDCLNNLERVADHCSNIAFSILEAENTDIQSHSYVKNLRKNLHEEFQNNINLFASKYLDRLDDTK